MSTQTLPPQTLPYFLGGWLPRDHRVLERWLSEKIQHVEQSTHGRNASYWHPVIREFQRVIEEDPLNYMLFHQMFKQVPTKPPYNNDPTGKPQVRDYHLMLALFNHILTTAPSYQDNDLVGFPINAILNWPMGTKAGFQAFTDAKVNRQFRKMFDVWVTFLTSPASRYVLTEEENGWFGPKASAAIPNFAQTFICDPGLPYYGFSSWDDFFTRRFRDGVRPVFEPENDRIVVAACESTVYNIAYNVNERDQFWLKGQPYSLAHILADEVRAKTFAGGTVFQAFLSALNYHRWHAPIRGTIVGVVLVPGTYYAENTAMGMDPAGPNDSQSFITALAARAIVYIEADSQDIGLMAFVAVGMAEVSTCEVTVRVGQHVEKGEEIGMFHFGGSTHCLIFRPETKFKFAAEAEVNEKIKLGTAIAVVGEGV